MKSKTYKYQPDKNILKQGAFLTDEDGKVVYEAKMLKMHLFGGNEFSFTNHITNKEEEHKVGNTITVENSTNGSTDILSTKSWFKFDGKNIWDFLHEEGIRIDTKPSSGKIGFDYDVTLKGKPFAEIKMSGKVIGIRSVLNLITSEENLDLAFLVTFAIARTNQTFIS